MWIHLTTGFGWPSGGEQPRMTLSPIVAVVFTGLIRKSLWMSATSSDAYKEGKWEEDDDDGASEEREIESSDFSSNCSSPIPFRI